MAAKRKVKGAVKYEVLDRARHQDGTRGTVVNVHKDADALSVLPDDRSRSLGTILWHGQECEKLPPSGGSCPRCSARHSIFYCPEGI